MQVPNVFVSYGIALHITRYIATSQNFVSNSVYIRYIKRYIIVTTLHRYIDTKIHNFYTFFHKIFGSSILKKFLNNKPFKVVELDKNVGSGVISNEFYDKLTMDSLNDENVYEKIFSDPLINSVSEIKKELELLFLSGSISKKLYNAIKIDGKLGSFRILPKIHKNVFGCRPIINYKNHFLNDICLLLNFIIRPYVINTESYIKDSQNLIQKTKDIKIPNDYIMASADFSSLYSNIDHEDCINNLTDFFKDKLESEHINIKGFYVIIKLILNYNFFGSMYN